MNKFLFLGLLLFVSCASREKITKPFYWQANRGEQTYHFLGTFHVGFELDDFSESIKSDLRSTEILAIEADQLTEKEMVVSVTEMLNERFSHIKDHYPQLKEKFSLDAWRRLSFTLESQDVKKFIFSKGVDHSSKEIHPSLIYIVLQYFSDNHQWHVFHPDLLSTNHRLIQLKLLDERSSALDKEIEQFARQEKIRTIGLDNVGQIISALYPKDEDPFIKDLEALFAVKRINEVQYKNLKMQQQIYRKGIEKDLIQEFPVASDHQDALLINRNKYWFDKLIQLEEKKVFVAVGALHLVGEDSLLSYFKDRGFEVRRVLK